MLFTQLFEGDFNKKKINEGVDQEDCDLCNGTGEGLFDGESCHKCRGTGVMPSQYRDDDFDEPDDYDDNDYGDEESYYEKSLRSRGLGEGAGNIGAQIKAAYQKIYNAGDDAVEFAYYDSPIFAQYWDEYEGDLDSIIAEVDPNELQIILDELQSAVEDQGLAEGAAGDPYAFGDDDYMDIIQGMIDDNRRNMSPSRKPRVLAATKRYIEKNGGVFDLDVFEYAYDQIVEFSRGMDESQGVAEEKVRLDPKCWTGKKIGNPKTKIKGGVRVNNCVPAESVAEGSVDHRALGKHHEEMTDQELRKVGSKLPDSWDAAVFRRKLASHPKYAQALKHYDKSEYHFGKAARAARQGVAEGANDTIYPNATVIKSKNGKPVGEIYQDESGWGCFHYKADRGADCIESKEEAIEWLKDIAEEYRQDRSLREQGVAEAGEWTRTPSGDYINMHTGVRSSSMPKKSKPRVGNRLSDMTVGSPKIVHKGGRAVGEIGLDHDPSPGQGPYYMKHYETNTWYSGYDTKKEALADLKHVVDQMNEGIGADTAKLGGIAALGIAGGLAGNYADQQQPKVEIGGKIAFVEPAHSRVPDSAMTLTGKDGKTYRVWATKGTAQSPQRYHAVPAEEVKEGEAPIDTDWYRKQQERQTRAKQKQGVSEADKKKDELEPEVRDVALQRAIGRAKAEFPSAGSGIEALAKDFMRGQEQDQKSFDQIRQAERQQNQMLDQISKIDQEQEQEIRDLENQNSTLSQRLQKLQSVNSQLEKKLATMGGRKDKRDSDKLEPAPSIASTPASVAATTAAPADTSTAEPTTSAAIDRMAQDLTAEPSKSKALGQMTKSLTNTPSTAIDQMAQQLQPRQKELPLGEPVTLKPKKYDTSKASDAAYRELTSKLAKDIVSDPERAMKTFNPVAAKSAAAQQEMPVEAKNKPETSEVDYDDPRWDAMVKRVGQLAKQGPRKTVWDPDKRVYKTVPVKNDTT